MNSILYLPNELIITIGLFCDYKTMLNFNQINKHVHNSINFKQYIKKPKELLKLFRNDRSNCHNEIIYLDKITLEIMNKYNIDNYYAIKLRIVFIYLQYTNINYLAHPFDLIQFNNIEFAPPNMLEILFKEINGHPCKFYHINKIKISKDITFDILTIIVNKFPNIKYLKIIDNTNFLNQIFNNLHTNLTELELDNVIFDELCGDVFVNLRKLSMDYVNIKIIDNFFAHILILNYCKIEKVINFANLNTLKIINSGNCRNLQLINVLPIKHLTIKKCKIFPFHSDSINYLTNLKELHYYKNVRKNYQLIKSLRLQRNNKWFEEFYNNRDAYININKLEIELNTNSSSYTTIDLKMLTNLVSLRIQCSYNYLYTPTSLTKLVCYRISDEVLRLNINLKLLEYVVDLNINKSLTYLTNLQKLVTKETWEDQTCILYDYSEIFLHLPKTITKMFVSGCIINENHFTRLTNLTKLHFIDCTNISFAIISNLTNLKYFCEDCCATKFCDKIDKIELFKKFNKMYCAYAFDL